MLDIIGGIILLAIFVLMLLVISIYFESLGDEEEISDKFGMHSYNKEDEKV